MWYSWVNPPTQRSVEMNGVSHMRYLQEPTDEPLEPHTETAMRHTAVLTKFPQPFVASVTGLAFLYHPLIEHRQRMDFLGDAKKLAKPPTCDQISRLRSTSVGCVYHIGERLDGSWNTNDPKRSVAKSLTEHGFLIGTQAFAKLDVGTLRLETVHRLGVVNARKRSFKPVATHLGADDARKLATLADTLLAYIMNELLNHRGHVLEVHERQLRLDVPVLHEVSLGAALFGAKTGTDVVNLLEGVDSLFEIEPDTLRQVYILSMYFDRHSRTIVIQWRWRQNRRVDLNEPIFMEPLMHDPCEDVPELQDGGKFLISEIEMSLIQKLLLQPWILDVYVSPRIRRDTDSAHADDFDIVNVDFPRRICSSSIRKDTSDLNRRFLAHSPCEFENNFLASLDHTLPRTGGVRNVQEDNMVVSTASFHPTVEHDRCPFLEFME